MFKFIKILMLSMMMLTPVICAQTFPELKKQIQFEKDNIKFKKTGFSHHEYR